MVSESKITLNRFVAFLLSYGIPQTLNTSGLLKLQNPIKIWERLTRRLTLISLNCCNFDKVITYLAALTRNISLKAFY